MSITDVRAAFILAGAGALALHDAAMRHVGDGAHVLHLIGAHRDGARFDHVSQPFRGDPDQRAREIAAELIAARAMTAHSASIRAFTPVHSASQTRVDALKDGLWTRVNPLMTIITQQEDRPMPAPAPI